MRARVWLTNLMLVSFVVACGDQPTEVVPERGGEVQGAGTVALATSSTEDGLSITTDKDDYSPGDTVWFAGAGWPANDTLDIRLDDEPATHEPHLWWVPVSEDGTFRDSTYVVDVGDVGVTFTLAATSRSTGRSLTVSFTDGNIRAASAPSGVQFVLSRRTYTGDGCTGTETVIADVTIGNTPFSTVATAGGTGQPSSAKLIAAATSTLGAAFNAWSSTSAFSIVGGDPKVICVEGGSGNFDYLATYDATPDLTISKTTSGTFEVGSSTAAYSFTVTNSGTATAQGSAANRITATDALPSGLTPPASPFSVNNWDCTVSGQTVTCQLAAGQAIAPGGTRTFSFGVGITSGACPSVTNSASIGGGNEPAGNAGNNGTGNVVTTISGCTVPNTPPTADAGGPYTGTEGTAIPLDGSGSGDTDGTVDTYTWTLGTFTNPDGGTCQFVGAVNTGVSPSVICDDNGTLTVSLTVTDDDGESSAADEGTVTVSNVAPTGNADVAGLGYAGSEGTGVALSGSKSDPGSNDTHTYAWGYAPVSGVDAGASCSFTNGTTLTPTVTCTDDGTFKVTLTVTDDDGDSSPAAEATLSLTNVAPSINSLTLPIAPVKVGDLVSLSATFGDVGSNDTHTSTIVWDDGTTDGPTAATAPNVSGSHTYVSAGIYEVRLTVTDDDTGADTEVFQYVVVYDPTAGFVTGGGWINSPAGAFLADPGLTGKANFGFVSKYLKGATVPTGNTEFQFHAGSLNFSSTSYEWLVVQGSGSSKATYKGSGTVNGVSGYGFLLSAIDGAPDKFRIKIWQSGGSVVYDNQVSGGAGDNADPTTSIAGGSIVIHVPKK
jgi:uncharacterized repeat protein (TIGR01451 family)